MPGSKALGARLATEEAKLAQLEAERAALTDQRPKVMPHPALIARYVEDLLTTLDTDAPRARAQGRGLVARTSSEGSRPFRR